MSLAILEVLIVDALRDLAEDKRLYAHDAVFAAARMGPIPGSRYPVGSTESIGANLSGRISVSARAHVLRSSAYPGTRVAGPNSPLD